MTIGSWLLWRKYYSALANMKRQGSGLRGQGSFIRPSGKRRPRSASWSLLPGCRVLNFPKRAQTSPHGIQRGMRLPISWEKIPSRRFPAIGAKWDWRSLEVAFAPLCFTWECWRGSPRWMCFAVSRHFPQSRGGASLVRTITLRCANSSRKSRTRTFLETTILRS